MWPFTKPKPKPVESRDEMHARVAAETKIEMDEAWDRAQRVIAELDGKPVPVKKSSKADNHKQWCQSIHRQAMYVMSRERESVSAFRFACSNRMRQDGHHDWIMRSAVSQQVEAQQLKKKLRRTLKAYGISFFPVMSQWRLRARFERKAWRQR